MNEERSRFLRSLSAANLCFIRVWSELFSLTSAGLFFRKFGPLAVWHYSAMLNVTILAAVLYVASRKRWLWLQVLIGAVALKEVLFVVSKLDSRVTSYVANTANLSPRGTLMIGLFSLAFLIWLARRFSILNWRSKAQGILLGLSALSRSPLEMRFTGHK